MRLSSLLPAGLRRSLALALSVLALTGVSALGSAAPASAQPPPAYSFDTGAVKLYDHSFLGATTGSCFAQAWGTWTRSTNTLSVTGSAWSTAWNGGCRARWVADLVVSPPGGGQFRIHQQGDIPTACSTTDPTCSSRSIGHENVSTPPFVAPYVAGVEVWVERR